MSSLMAARAPLRVWQCPQCTTRAFSTSLRTQVLGPEHPRYITLQEPPQQSGPNSTRSKGHLPVPRNVFNGAEGQDKASDAWISRATQKPKAANHNYAPGSRMAWESQMSKMRRSNMRQGLRALRARKDKLEASSRYFAARKQAKRDELLNTPERLDEQLTAPDHGINLEALEGPLTDPMREARLAHKRENIERHAEKKLKERTEAVEELYFNARDFIVSAEQLENAIEEAFGTDEYPVYFGDNMRPSLSIWGEGVPETAQDMLNRTSRNAPAKRRGARAPSTSKVTTERITRIAEVLTGGKIEVQQAKEDRSL